MMIRKATSADIPAVAVIYDALLRREEQGLLTTGWTRGVYPTEQTAWDALDAGTLYVLEDGGRVTAAAKIDHHQMAQYAQCAWRNDAPPEQVLVLHTLVVDPAVKGKGYGTAFVRFYEDMGREELPAHRHQRPQHACPGAVQKAGLHRGGHRGRYVQRHPRRGAGMSGKNRIAVANTTDKQQDPTYNKGNDTQRRARNGYRTRNDAEF